MRMRAAVPAALNKGRVLMFIIIDALPRERSDFLWQQVSKVGNLYSLDVLVAGIDDRAFAGGLLPFERQFRAVHVETFPVLPDSIKQRPGHLAGKV